MKKGFTIIEILVSLALVLTLTVMVAINVVDLGDKQKAELYNSKIELILSEAKAYGNSILSSLTSSCYEVSVGELIEKGYLQEEKTREDGVGEIYDPRDNSSINELKVCVSYENGKIKSYLKEEN